MEEIWENYKFWKIIKKQKEKFAYNSATQRQVTVVYIVKYIIEIILIYYFIPFSPLTFIKSISPSLETICKHQF